VFLPKMYSVLVVGISPSRLLVVNRRLALIAVPKSIVYLTSVRNATAKPSPMWRAALDLEE
jgi:hypothetical protein